MDWLQNAMRKEGLTPQASANASLRSKLLQQADRMIGVLENYTSDNDLDGSGSKYWWAPQSVEGKRRVVMRAESKIVEGSSVYADNTLASVKETVKTFRKIIENSKDGDWAEEVARREKK